jgi:hypothetical protein
MVTKGYKLSQHLFQTLKLAGLLAHNFYPVINSTDLEIKIQN